MSGIQTKMAEKSPKKEKEFKCEVCGKTFSKKIALIGHKRTHQKKKKEGKKEEKKKEKPKEPKEEKKYSPLNILLIVAVLVIGVGIGYYLFSPKGGQVAETTTTFLTPSGENVVTQGKIVTVDYIGKFENGSIFATSIEDKAKEAGITM